MSKFSAPKGAFSNLGIQIAIVIVRMFPNENFGPRHSGGMTVNAITKTRIGFALALSVLIGVGEAILFSNVNALEGHQTIFCMVSGGAGLVLWLIGQLCAKAPEVVPITEAGTDSTPAEHPLVFLRSVRYWGMIFVLSTGGFFGFTRLSSQPSQPVVAVVKPPVVFPSLDLQGVTLNGARSSALINGQVLFIGEGIGNVQLIAVDGEHATVGLEGQTKVLSLRQ